MVAQKKLVVANWKMNPATLTEAKKIFNGSKRVAVELRQVQTVICPPVVYLDALRRIYRGNRISFGVQDCFWEDYGAYTGQLSPVIAKNNGARYAILGHSERRLLGEDDAAVGRKVAAVVRHGLTAVICVGETRRDQDGLYWAFLKNELEEAVRNISAKELGRFVIAYEPVWAIGKTATDALSPEDLHEASLYIRKVLHGIFGDEALAVPVLYGGSVEPANTEALLKGGQVQGLLVGHKSLDPKAFGEILKIVDAA